MCAGITLSTEESHDASIEAWGAIYDDNIAIKYYEVVGLLFESNRKEFIFVIRRILWSISFRSIKMLNHNFIFVCCMRGVI